jgi:hypothetical protein
MKTARTHTAMDIRPTARPINVSLTIDERDAIDAAKGRALRLTEMAARLIDGGDGDDDVDPAGLCDLLDLIREDLTMITAQFAGADDRQADVKGGA